LFIKYRLYFFSAYHAFFAKVNDTTFIKTPFDFSSVTFFFPFAYAKDPSKPTMQANYEGEVFPWEVSLSPFDIENVREGYGCGRGKQVLSILYIIPYYFGYCCFLAFNWTKQ